MSFLLWLMACEHDLNHPYNILLVSVCSYRVDHLSLNGYGRNTSPHLDAFAQDAVVFENSYSNATFTDISHASMFTGLYPGHDGMVDLGEQIAADVPTLAEVLGHYNYRVMALMDRDSHFNPRGFIKGFGTAYAAPGDDLHTALSKWVALEDRPWFAWIHLRRAHLPYGNGQPYAFSLHPAVIDWLGTIGRPSQHPVEPPQPGSRAPDGAYRDWQERVGKDPSARQSLYDAYDSSLHDADAQFGRLIEGVAGVLQNTIVVLVGDHGEALGEFEQVGHQGVLAPPVLRVPMVIKVPDLPGRRESAVVSLVDLMPTLLELTGAMQPARQDGRSLVPALRGMPMEDRPVLAQAVRLVGDDRHVTFRNALVSPPYYYISDIDSHYLMKVDGPEHWTEVTATDPERASQMQVLSDTLSEGSTWRSLRPELPAGLKEELRKRGYW